MGRKKITIQPIKDERNRHVTFNKRKSGLIKKAMELSILCNCQISLVIFNAENQLYEYCSTDPRYILQRYCQVAHLPHERLTNNDYNRYDRAGRGKGKTGGKGKGDASSSAAGEDEAESEVPHTAGVVDQRLQQSVNQFAQKIDDNILAQQAAQMPTANFAVAPFATPGGVMTPRTAQMGGLNPGLLDLTPLTPGTVQEVAKVMAGNMAGNQAGAALFSLLAQQQQRPQMQMVQTQGESQPQEDQSLSAQVSLQLPLQEVKAEVGSKRKEMDPSDDDGSSSTPSKKRRTGLTVQVPHNRNQVPLRRVEDNDDEEQETQLEGGLDPSTEDNINTSIQVQPKVTDTTEQTPLLYSPLPTDETTPLNLNTPTDWTSPSKHYGAVTQK